MQLIFCVISSFILGNVDSGALDVVKKLEDVNDDFDRKTEFADLDRDCLFLIFEGLDLRYLLSVAQINEKFSALAADTFRRKYSTWQIVINDQTFYLPNKLINSMNVTGMKIDTDSAEQIYREISTSPYNAFPSIDSNEHNRQIRLENFNAIWNTFKHFGHVIKKLKFFSGPRTEDFKKALLGFLISEHSSESVADIEIYEKPHKFLQYITKSLIKLENLTYHQSHSSHLGVNHLCELLPAVRRLSVAGCEDEDLTNFDCYMPHLEHIFTTYDEPRLLEIFSKNPQIRSIRMMRADFLFVQKMSTLLPQLDTLIIDKFKPREGIIRFENVTTFEIDDPSFISPATLQFPRLQALRLSHESELFDKHLTFLSEHNRLSHLYVKGYYKMSDSQFQQLTANLTDLVELTLEGVIYLGEVQHLSSRAIVEFLRSNVKVKQLNVIRYNKNWIVDLKEQLKHGWSMKVIKDGLSFERESDN